MKVEGEIKEEGEDFEIRVKIMTDEGMDVYSEYATVGQDRPLLAMRVCYDMLIRAGKAMKKRMRV